MTYPPDGETVHKTIRNTEFGFGGYGEDEPAPSSVLVAFLRTRNAWQHRDAMVRRNDRCRTREAYFRMAEAIARSQMRYAELLRLMQKYKYRTLVADGYRLRLAYEPDGCRRARVDMQEIDEIPH